MARIAFVGLGRMGQGMAGRLLGAGHDLVVVNRTPGRADDLVACGAGRAATPAEAAAGADAVVVMVSDDEASRSVWLGPDGVLAGRPAPGTLALDCSTLSHDWLLELAGATSRRGLRFLDCPVTGLPDAAAAGELTLLVGADPDDLAAAQPLLEPMSQAVLHFGPVGTGNAYKLAINLMGAVQIAAAAELLAIAERAGLDLEQVADAVATSQAASPQVVRNTRRMVATSHHDDVVFSGRLRRKDTAYGMALAEGLGVDAAFGRVALSRLDELLAAGLGDVNESAVVEVARAARPGGR
ncbi:MAG TPA: NAD(P)-dependent oxidoreductase [Actinomycetes bacterium]|nr:NAD(P)-dependent oxidoreductase [Actinomycetes bacterium]